MGPSRTRCTIDLSDLSVAIAIENRETIMQRHINTVLILCAYLFYAADFPYISWRNAFEQLLLCGNVQGQDNIKLHS